MKISHTYRPLIWLIIISSIIRVFLAQFIELGNDEVYYFTYALYPDWSHFDHPPMVGWMIQLFSFNQFMHSQVLLRLSAIIFAAANTFLIFKLGEKVNNKTTGWYAALLYNASLYTSIIAGVFIMPDTPQLLFWILSLYLMVDILPEKTISRKSEKKFLLLGLLIGLGMLSKYTSVFLWGGIFFYLVFHNRNWFKSLYLYLAGIISLLIFSPVLLWNKQHHFISFTFHEDRVNLTGTGVRFDLIGTEIIGEFLYQNPIIFVISWIAVVFVIRRRKEFKSISKLQILLYQSLPMVAVFLFFSLFRRTLPHWTGPAYLSLIILAAFHLSRGKENNTFAIPGLIKSSLVLIVFILGLGFTQINYGIIDLKKLSGNDITTDVYGWRKLNEPFSEIKKENENARSIQKNAPIISYRWFPAAHLDYYVAYPNNTHVLGIGSLERIHKYAWMNEERGGFHLGMDAWFLSFDYDYKSPDFLKPYFSEIIPADTILVKRSSETVKEVYVYILKDMKKIPSSDFLEFMQKAKNP